MKEGLNKRDIGEDLARMRTMMQPSGVGGGGGDSSMTMSDSIKRVTQLHSYDGRFNILPKNYIIPTLTLASFLSFYLLGSPREGVPPFRIVKPKDLNLSNKGQKVNSKILTDMKKMISYVERAGTEVNLWEMKIVQMILGQPNIAVSSPS